MNFATLDAGKSLEGLPILTYKSHHNGDHYLYLISGVHGDQVEGVYLLQKILRGLQENQELEELPMIIVPIVNVDGYRDQNGLNSHGVNLNRNFPTQDWPTKSSKKQFNPGPEAASEPETQFLLNLFKQYPPGLLLNFTTKKPLISYQGRAEGIAKFLHAYNQYPVKDLASNLPAGSLDKFLNETYQAPSLAIQAPKLTQEKSLHDIWEENEVAFEKLFSSEMAKSCL